MRRILSIIKKEFLHVFRDPRMIALLLFIPIFQTLIFGIVVKTDITDVNILIVDHDKTFLSRSFIDDIIASGYFELKEYTDDLDKLDENIKKGNVRAAFIIPDGFSEFIKRGEKIYLETIIDGTDSNTSSLILKYTSSIIQRFAQKNSDSNPSIQLQSRAFYNPNLESRYFFVPGVVALIITVIITLLSSMAIVREKESGTIEQIMVTPIRKYEFILGKTIPFAIIGYVDTTLALLVATFAFGIPFLGNIFLLYFGATFYILAILGVGLFISTISSTQQEAMMTSFLFIFPLLILSGFIFPIFNMPFIVRIFTFLNPLRYFLVIIRSIFLKGSGISILYKQFIALIILSFSFITISIIRFKKNI
ncbi:MAG: ABC transporter permease [Candidatus Muiribacterium halophilum]|uniref:Transport permease protein n=1 Tax=Muiribacterium halophilum TaxID=2053465 RepID=A0A2N5Z9G9_MUIH1|nr:MAG: ABC transporter permease [Candidatus Muirbacterium halophilum]